MSLPYGLPTYVPDDIIHVLICGYSYRAKVVDSTEKTVIVDVDGKNHEIQKTNTFR